MTPFQVEISTAITVIVIACILSVYLLVLKRNGWIGKAAIEKSQTKNTNENEPKLKTQESSRPIIFENKVAPSKKENKEPEIIETKALTVIKEENKIAKKLNNEKSNTKKNVPEGCNHYFGYLCALPKGTITPDECYCCVKLIDCYKEAKET